MSVCYVGSGAGWGDAVRFVVLGPLQVIAGEPGEPGAVLAPRLRALLAVLLWQANQPVPVDELAELVWDGAPPRGAPDAMRALVMRLRRRLDTRTAARIVTRAPGYAIEITGSELDASLFEALTQQAGAAVRAGHWAQAARTAGEALGLRRGTPLTDVPSQLLRDQWVPHLDQLQVQALDWRIEGDLHQGRHEQLIPELLELTGRHPLREHFHGQLMLALTRSGRQAEALIAYQRARDVLAGELGVEPGPLLRELHQRILSGDPALAVTGPARKDEPGRAPGAGPARELPPAVPGFTGREAELQALTGLAGRLGDHAPQAVVIWVIGGTAGVGKTALAVQWAHRAAARFPDGQLYVNLRGYDPGQPLPATDALAGFLRSLGVPGPDIPPEADQRAARYRSLLAGKRMLVVLDNAGSADQVRPLLPGTPSSTVVVTSRDALAGLVARDGATRLDLDVLPQQDAVALLRTLIGARADVEPEAAAELAGRCARLPLALRVAAELAASRPSVPLAGLAGELADLGTRLDLLAAGGDYRTQVRTVFSWSYRHLDAGAARTFRLIGLHPGPDIEPYAAAALTGTAVPQARRTLEALARGHLIQATVPGRYGLHDLLRAYARELTTAEDDQDDRQAALTRLFDYYLHAAATAMDTLFPAERQSRPRIPRQAISVPPLAAPAAAWDWLDGERATLVAVADHTAAHGWPSHATRLAIVLSRYLDNRGHISEALTIFSHALGAARRTGDRADEATALIQIGNVDWQLSRLQQAGDRYRQALTLFREAGDRAGEARALGNIGLAEAGLGHYEQAARHHQEAVAIDRDIGDRLGEARALGNLGLARQRQGRYHEAAAYHQQSLDLFREIGDRPGEAWALGRLGVTELQPGRYQHAVGYLQQALALFQEMRHTFGESEALSRLGDACLELGRYEQATGNFERALAICREIGDPLAEAEVLNGLGDVLFRTGDSERARVHHATALRLASEVGSPRQQARAHSGLARTYQASGDSLQARHHWQEALTRADAIGASEARAQLTTLNFISARNAPVVPVDG
jgi:DNA-binding SARP family transcriptional activator/tetratricopeptide (TPR) repeat protein